LSLGSNPKLSISKKFKAFSATSLVIIADFQFAQNPAPFSRAY